ncbi:PCNA-interacting partner-like [Physella acuta]|uniref:PCNA-interacting partner-like n=1 Tax=Physella acuta TaxID=109671 RepID=UPI0027DBA631|nr:PCNA-interacting partner-like [Physella acuta]
MMAEKQQVPLMLFTIEQCRKFSLFPNERTTLISQADEMQIVQYCLACYNKLKNEEFDADPKDVLTILDYIKSSDCHKIEEQIQFIKKSVETTDVRMKKTIQATSEPCFEEDGQLMSQVSVLYQEYKTTSNHWSLADTFLSFLKALADPKSELYVSLSSNRQVLMLKPDVDDFSSLQLKVIEILKQAYKGETDPETIDHVCEEAQMVGHIPSTPTVLCEGSQTTGHTPSTPSVLTTARGEESQQVPGVSPTTPYPQCERKELQKILIEDIFRSYLHLLVNSRSQLALARVFNIPERGLDITAFTHLKHEAQSTGLSLYQTLSSYMLRIHLGGSGYAPATDSPLLAYVKGLGSLLDLTQKLQTIVEEVTDLSMACRRIIQIIKTNLVRCKSGKFLRNLVEPVSERTYNILTDIIQRRNTAEQGSPDKPVSSGGSMSGRRCTCVLQSYLDQTAVVSSHLDQQMMSDIRFSSQTPTRIPCLLTQFRSPAIMDTEEEAPSEVNSVSTKPRGPKKAVVSAALYIDADQDAVLSQGTLSSVDVIPSKTIAHPRPDHVTTTSLRETTTSSVVVRNAKGSKRCIVSSKDQENLTLYPGQDASKAKLPCQQTLVLTDSPKSSRAGHQQGKSSKSCRRRLLPQVKGQAKITGFFRI